MTRVKGFTDHMSMAALERDINKWIESTAGIEIISISNQYLAGFYTCLIAYKVVGPLKK